MSGLCKCGCGRQTNLAPQTDTRRGWVQGEPLRYIQGHTRRLAPVEQDRGYETTCHIWPGKLNARGYAHNRHRRDWVHLNGPIPDGYDLDHLCRQRDCVRLDHLELVTHAENVRRGSVAQALEAPEDPAGIRELRGRLGLTQAALATELGVSRALVGLWENGRHPIMEPHQTRLAEIGARA